MFKKIFKRTTIPRKYETLINDINELESNLKLLSDADLLVKSINLQNSIKRRKI